MMVFKITRAKVHSPDGDTDVFDIVTGVLQGYTFVPYGFIIYHDYVLRTSMNLMKENGFILKKKKKRARSRLYFAETITDTENADDMALQANTPTQTESLHSL